MRGQISAIKSNYPHTRVTLRPLFNPLKINPFERRFARGELYEPYFQGDDFLLGGLPASSGRETHERRVSANCAGILIAQDVVNVALVTVSVMVMVSVVPSYVMCTWKISPLCRFTPPPSVIAGLVGDAPLVYRPVEFIAFVEFWNRSNFTATLVGMPGVPPGNPAPYPKTTACRSKCGQSLRSGLRTSYRPRWDSLIES